MAPLVAFGVACGGGPGEGPGDAGPDARSADAEVDSSAEDGGPADAGPGEPEGFDWEDCHGGFRCADFPVPRDHDDPDGPSIDVRVLRHPATKPSERIGVLIFQPGGPGAPAVSLAAEVFVPTARLLLPDLLERFDIVAVEPRGAGESSPVVDCVDGAELDEMRELDVTPDGDADWSEIVEFWQGYVEGCADRTGTGLLANVARDDLVRDIELVRQALGEDELNCLCDGAYVGARYANLFPEHVRAFSLVSVSDPSPTPRLSEGWVPGASYEAALTDFLERCGGDGGCAFHGGEGTAAVRDAFDALLASTESSPLELADGRRLGSVDFRAGVVGALRNPEDPTLGEALAAAEAGDPAPLMGKADGFFGRAEDGTYDAFLEVNLAMSLAGNPCPESYDLSALQTDVADVTAEAPYMGPLFMSRDHACLAWPDVGSGDSPITATTAPPLLLVNNTDDPTTPLSQARAMQEALDNGSYLLAREGAGHGLGIYQSGCVLEEIGRFLADPTTTPSTDTCTD